MILHRKVWGSATKNSWLPISHNIRKTKIHRYSTILALVVASALPSFSTAATVQGNYFVDVNNNGAKDQCEPIRSKTTVLLRDNTKADVGKEGAFYSTETDVNGNYLIKSLDTDSFTIWTDIPFGFSQTAPVRGEGFAFYDFNVANVNDTVTINFGVLDPTASITGPTVNVTGSTMSVNMDSSTHFTATVVNPADVCAARWDFGDGASADGLDADHTYTVPGTYTATATVTDKGGKTGTAKITVTVKNVLPIAQAKAEPITIHLGDVIAFTGNFTDTANDTTHTFEWDFGDGNTANSQNASHVYDAKGTYSVTLKVTDKFGGVGTVKISVTVKGALPIVNAGADVAIDAGQSFTFGGSFTDPDGVAPYNYKWDFGDGNTSAGTINKTGALSVSHPFTQEGSFTVTLEVTDKEGNVGKDTLIISVRGINTDPCITTVPTMQSQSAWGMWNNPNMWGGRVPGINDWVLVKSGHTVVLPTSLSSVSAKLQVKGVCIEQGGVLQSAFNSLTAPASWVNVFAAIIHNYGTIQGSNGINAAPIGDNYKTATAGSSIKFFAYKFINDTTGKILAIGRGGDDIPYLYYQHQSGVNGQGGEGGRIEIYPTVMTNSGRIEGGRGGDAKGFRDANLFMVGNMIGGNGGLVRVMATSQSQSSSSGQLIGGCGGNAEGINSQVVSPGIGGAVTMNVGSLSGQVAICPGSKRIHSPIYQPVYQHDCKKFLGFKWRCRDVLVGWNFVGWDPEQLKASSTASFENLDRLVIYAGKDGVIDLSEVQEGAIAAEDAIIIAAGEGGVVDLSKVTSKVFKTKQLQIAADKVLLLGGKVLTPTDQDLSALNAIAQVTELSITPAQIIYNAEFSNPDHVVGEPNATIPIELTLLNVGPTEDTYTISVTSSAGWSVDGLPETITINSQRRSDLTLNVTLPTTRGQEEILTVTATSQGNPDLEAVAKIKVGVVEQELITPRNGTKASLSIVLDNTINMVGQTNVVSNALEAFFANDLNASNKPFIELMTFNDKEVISRVVTQDVGDIIGRIRGITPTGEGNCSALSIASLESALSNLNSDGQIILVTATSPEKEAVEVIEKLKAQGIKVHVLLAGSCNNEEMDKAIYQGIAEGTGGFFKWLPRGLVPEDTFKEVMTTVITSAVKEITPLELPKPPTVGTYKTSGTLTDKFGNAVEGAIVTVGDKTTVTDLTGHWEIANLLEGNYPVTISKEGFVIAPQQCALGNNQDCELNLKPVSMLTLKVTPPKQADQGKDLTYMLTLTNKGTHPATDIVLKDILPKNATVVSMNVLGNGTCDVNITTCTLADLAPKSTAKVQLVVSNTHADKLVNTASVTANEYPADLVVTYTEVKPYLSVTPSCTPEPVQMQSSLHCVIDVALNQQANQGTATGIQVTLQLPSGVSLTNIQAETGTCDTSYIPTIVCDLSELAVSASSTGHSLINMDMQLTDAGLLSLTQEAKITASNYPTHSVRSRNTIAVPDGIEVDFAIVIDVTGSMSEEINAIKEAVRKYLNEHVDLNKHPTNALVTFRDEVRVEAYTTDMSKLLTALNKLKASGGGTCPEASAEALEIAIKHVKPGGYILIGTDASPYEDTDLEGLVQSLREKNIHLTTIITGDCSQGSQSLNELPTEQAAQ